VTNANKAKADQFERECAAYMAAHGFPAAERRKAGGARDVGDLYTVPGLVVECKDAGTIRLPAWMDQVGGEVLVASRGGTVPARGVLLVKRRRAGIERAYVVEELADWCEHNQPDR
jgi:hypothetical protein